MQTPRVSVIINTRNGAGTLTEALDSLSNQTFTDFEVIVWDDGSTDNSGELVKHRQDPRIRYHASSESRGLGQARQSAMRLATGEWIAFLDQDDIWLPTKLQKQIAKIDSHPGSGIAYGRALAFLTNGRERDFDHRHEFTELPEGNIYKELIVNSCFICMSSAMLLRTAVEEVGTIPEFIVTTPDYYLFLLIAKKYPACAVQEVVCRYRLHDDSMSETVTSRMQEEAIWLIDRESSLLEPQLAKHRRRVHATVWGLDEMRRIKSVARGMARILQQGSVPYLLSRPLAKTFRAIHRRVIRPYWKREEANKILAHAATASARQGVVKG